MPDHPISGVYSRISAVAQQYEPISLAEMMELDSVILLDRIDIKYLLSPEQLLQTLAQVGDHYRVLSVEAQRLQHYQTLYFDTANFVLYEQHHNDARSRYKIRFRTYVNSELSFLEVKVKNNKDRTLKSRIEVPVPQVPFTPAMVDFLSVHTAVNPLLLAPKISNSFLRITLVGKEMLERITVDLDVQFDDDNIATRCPRVVIVEVKQDHFSPRSPFIQQMRAVKSCEVGITKYCIGAALRYPRLKVNNFKPAFLQIAKVSQSRYWTSHERVF